MYNIRTIVQEDEKGLKELFAQNDMKGDISLALETPSFFEALKVYKNHLNIHFVSNVDVHIFLKH